MNGGDVAFVAEMLADPLVMRYYPKPLSRDEAAQWVERQCVRYAKDGHGLWLVVEKNGGPVGQVGLAFQEVEDERLPEIGWLVHQPFQRKGFATEAAIAVRDWALARYERIVSLIRPVNVPSRRVAEKIGMRAGPLVEFHGYAHVLYERARDARRRPCAAVPS